MYNERYALAAAVEILKLGYVIHLWQKHKGLYCVNLQNYHNRADES